MRTNPEKQFSRNVRSRLEASTPALLLALLTLFVGAPATEARIIHVDTHGGAISPSGFDWFSAYQTLQQALDVATDSDEIWVTRAGQHKPSQPTDPGDPRSATFLIPRAVKIYGGFAGTEEALEQRHLAGGLSTLSGNIGIEASAADNAYHVLTATDSIGIVIDGFVIEQGKADGLPALLHGRGGGMRLEQAGVRIANCRFTDNNADDEGAALWVVNTFLDATDCDFTGNNADFGGAVFLRRSPSEFSECDFTGNTAKEGGAVYDDASSNLDFTLCTFEQNSLTDPGGRGGAIFAVGDPDNGSSLTLSGGWLKNNTAHEGGGLFLGANILARVASLLTGNQANGDGGAIRLSGNSTLNLLFSSLAENHADGFGGAVASEAASLFLRDTDFYDNSAGRGGGAVSAKEQDLLDWESGICAFNSCTGDSGGALRLENVASITVRSPIFRENSVTDDNWSGGAVEIIDDAGATDAWFSECRFLNNQAWYGGAVKSNAKTLVFDGCHFEGNLAMPKDGTAYGGGAVWAGGTTLVMAEDYFRSNSAPDGFGGAIRSVAHNLRMIDSVFYDNTADGGGAVSEEPVAPSVTPSQYLHCFFLGNEVVRSGGAVLLSGTLRCERCVFSDNLATIYGTAIFASQSELTLLSCVAAGNRGRSNSTIETRSGSSASGVGSPRTALVNTTVARNDKQPAVWASDGVLEIHNSIIAENGASDDRQVHATASVTTNFSYSMLGGSWSGIHLIDPARVFQDPDDPDGADDTWGTIDDGLTLAFNSPAVNAGDSLRAFPDQDLIGKDRIRDIDVDLGAYEQVYKDQDLDGFGDLAEWFAVTRLDDPHSHPGSTPIIDLASRTLTFFPKAGENYQIERSVDLANWEPMGDQISWEDAIIVLQLSDNQALLPQEFFRVIRLSQ